MRLDLLDRLLPLCSQILRRLASRGVGGADRPGDPGPRTPRHEERLRARLQPSTGELLKKLVATYFGGLEDNLGWPPASQWTAHRPGAAPGLGSRHPLDRTARPARSSRQGLVGRPQRLALRPGEALGGLHLHAERLGERLAVAIDARLLQGQWTWNAKTGWTPSAEELAFAVRSAAVVWPCRH
ncbi:hypothetical protein P4132_12105 [Pseudomonas aeruginosa]|nr:hypothetical protein [Pseudomonas aeruginosa]